MRRGRGVSSVALATRLGSRRESEILGNVCFEFGLFELTLIRLINQVVGNEYKQCSHYSAFYPVT